jgi:hypothetical protein
MPGDRKTELRDLITLKFVLVLIRAELVAYLCDWPVVMVVIVIMKFPPDCP